MNFEYNGNLSEDDRLKLVASEIITKYPEISPKKAIESAMLEGKISKDKTIDDELLRLYNIMLVNSNDKKIVTTIYNDFINLIKNNLIEEGNKFYHVAESINEYLNNISDFTVLSDFEE